MYSTMIGGYAALPFRTSRSSKVTGSRAVMHRIRKQFIVMPTLSQMEDSDLDLIVASTRDAIAARSKAFAREMTEDAMAAAIGFGHEQIKKIIRPDRRIPHQK